MEFTEAEQLRVAKQQLQRLSGNAPVFGISEDERAEYRAWTNGAPSFVTGEQRVRVLLDALESLERAYNAERAVTLDARIVEGAEQLRERCARAAELELDRQYESQNYGEIIDEELVVAAINAVPINGRVDVRIRNAEKVIVELARLRARDGGRAGTSCLSSAVDDVGCGGCDRCLEIKIDYAVAELDNARAAAAKASP